MDSGTSSGRGGQSRSGSADILSRIRATTASKPEIKIRQLENALSTVQAELLQLKEEQEALAEAYAVLEEERDNEVLNLKAELDRLVIASAALEKERDGWKSAALNPEPVEELTEKDTSALGASRSKGAPTTARKPVPGNLASKDESDRALETIHAGQSQSPRIGTSPSTVTGSFMSRAQAALMPTPEHSIRQLKDKVPQLSVQLDQTKAEKQDFRSQYNKLATDLQQAQLERNRFKEATTGQENELSVLRRKLKEAQDLAAIRGKELVGTQVFLTKADTVSMSEVIEKVSNLNEEIFQVASLLGECSTFRSRETTVPDLDGCMKVLGDKLTSILVEESRKEGPHEVNPLLAQVVFQVYLVNACHHLAESWLPSDPSVSGFIEGIYTGIRASEQQLVAGRWRALTRTHSRPSTDSWKNMFLVPLSCICNIANWAIADEAVRAHFEKKLLPIVKAVEDLRRAMGEQFTSADLHLTVIRPDQPFIGDSMEDAYQDGFTSGVGAEGSLVSLETVVGTVGFGLKRAEEDYRNGVAVFHPIQPPRVALLSTIMEAIAPPPPRKSRLKKGKGKS